MVSSTINILDDSIALYRHLLMEHFKHVRKGLIQSHLSTEAVISNKSGLKESDLIKIKEDISSDLKGEVDISLINSRGVIYMTTYPAEIGIDLSEIPDAQATMMDVKQSGRIRVDLPIFEPAGKVFRAYSISYIKDRGEYLQLGYKLSDFAGFNRILQSSAINSLLVDKIDLYLVHKESAGKNFIASFTDFSPQFPDEVQKSILKALNTNSIIDREVNIDNKFLKEFYKVIAKGDSNYIWYEGIEHHLIYRLRLDLTAQKNFVNISRIISILIFAALLSFIVYGFVRFRFSFLMPLANTVESIKMSKKIGDEEATGCCSELSLIAESYNYHLDTIKNDTEELNLINEELKRKNNELEKAVGEIKKLTGMLPICSSCKNIRNDEGYWQRVDDYISEHSEAEFTHSICPDCAKKLYLEYYDILEKRK